MDKIIDLRRLFQKKATENDERVQEVLQEIGNVFSHTSWGKEKSVAEIMQWLVGDIRSSWSIAQRQSISRQEFIDEYADELSEKFSRMENSPVNRASIVMAIETVLSE